MLLKIVVHVLLRSYVFGFCNLFLVLGSAPNYSGFSLCVE